MSAPRAIARAREHRLTENCWCQPEVGIALVGSLPPPPELDERSYSAIVKHNTARRPA